MKYLILDGHNLAWRLHKILPEMTARHAPIQVVYGLLRMIRSSILQFEPDVVLICWDRGRSEYRRSIYPDYKANRDHGSTEEKKREFKSFTTQVGLLDEVLDLLNIASVSVKGMEADDLIGISSCTLKGDKVIVTSDQDALHLVTSDTSVWSPHRTTLYTAKNFKQLIGVSPEQWLELRALTGDSSDNISGVAKGFGQQTAQELLLQYGSIEQLFRGSISKKVQKQGNRYALLYSDGCEEIIRRNLQLMDLRSSNQHPLGEKALQKIRSSLENRHKIDKLAVRQYFESRKFRSLLSGFSGWLLPFEDLDRHHNG